LLFILNFYAEIIFKKIKLKKGLTTKTKIVFIGLSANENNKLKISIMKSITNILTAAVIMLAANACNGQIKNAQTDTVKISGNCDMCKKNIETAGNVRKVSQVVWNRETKKATLTYNPEKTNTSEILKRIALVGYDNDSFIAPKEAYEALHSCCQYERVTGEIHTETKADQTKKTEQTHKDTLSAAQSMSELFNAYFSLKDALVNSNTSSATDASNSLLKTIKTVKMENLEADLYTVWMKVVNSITEHTNSISKSNEIESQRKHFMQLTEQMYELVKVAKPVNTVYYQHCPMANGGKGANWLSKSEEINNPYFGAAMLNCGKTIETIK
jgi:hypothetical protein